MLTQVSHHPKTGHQPCSSSVPGSFALRGVEGGVQGQPGEICWTAPALTRICLDYGESMSQIEIVTQASSTPTSLCAVTGTVKQARYGLHQYYSLNVASLEAKFVLWDARFQEC